MSGIVPPTLALPVLEERSYEVSPNYIGQPAFDFVVADVIVVPSSVTVSAPPDVHAAMPSVLQLGPLDISGADRNVSTRMLLQLADGATVSGSSDVQVVVIVRTTAGLGEGVEVVVRLKEPDRPENHLRLRNDARLSALEVDKLRDGTQATITGGPTLADGLRWWELDGRGWAAEGTEDWQWLRPR